MARVKALRDRQTLVALAQSDKVGRSRSIIEGDMYSLMSYFKIGYSVSLACVKTSVPRKAIDSHKILSRTTVC